jgi:hypothetical protein
MHTGMRKSPYAYGDLYVIPVCIRGLHINPRMHTGICASLYAYGDRMDTNPRMHTGILASLYAYGDFSVTPRMHNEVVRIWEI